MQKEDKRRIERLFHNTNYRKIFKEIGINYKDQNDGLWFNCIYPQHKESKPSSCIKIDPYNDYCGVFYCFGCKRSGTIIDIIREYLHNEFWEGVLWLEHRIDHDNIIYDYNINSIKRKTKITLPDEFESPPILQEWPSKYKNYLSKRNVSHFHTLKYNIGYCDKGKYRNMVIIPVTLGSKLVTWVGRHIKRKMVSGPKGGGQGLFGSNYLIQPKKYPAILVEGWADKIKMENIGYDNVMSIQTNKLSEDQFNFILSKGFQYIIVIPDNDSGGNTLINSLEKYVEYIPIYVGKIESKDPGESSEEELDFAIKNIKEWKPIVENIEIEIEY